MSSAIGSVVVAAAQSVAKVYVIGGIGYAAVKYPKDAPLLPGNAVSTLARFGFNVLTISLIFSTIASSVTLDSLGDYWFVLVGAFGVLALSFVTSTLLAKIIPINPPDFQALRISATFPNIVALPILIFPSLCEYPVVYEAFGPDNYGAEDLVEELDRAELFRQCVAKSNTMIFIYFLGWSLLFWSFGHPLLMNAANNKSRGMEEERQSKKATDNASKREETSTSKETEHEPVTVTSLATGTRKDSQSPSDDEVQSMSVTEVPPNSTDGEEDLTTLEDNAGNSQPTNTMLQNILGALKQTFTSPPFLTMVLAFIVGCITPVRDLLFSQGGALRFLGAAIETLGQASSPLSTMIVAASLASRTSSKTEEEEEEQQHLETDNSRPNDEIDPETPEQSTGASDVTPDADHNNNSIEGESPVMSDPNFGPLQLRRRSSIHRFGASLRQSSVRAIKKARRTPPDQRRLLLWFTLSRLILSPALVILAIVGLDCSGVLASSGVPDLAKLVLIVNSSVPGALIVVVLLKSNPALHETAAVVAKVYLPTYIFSIVTIAAWTAVGLIVSIPDEDGNSFCAQYYL